MKREEIPVWRKYSLSVQEAAVYFGIGEKRLREFIAYGLEDDCFITIGSHIRIKREKFAERLDEMAVI